MAKKTAESLVDGLFMGAGLLQSLLKQIVRLGGHPEMLHYLTTENGKENLNKVAELIVRSEWKIPASLMQSLVYDYCRDPVGCSAERALVHSYHYWACVFAKYFPHITTFNFETAGGNRYGYDELPEEVGEQLLGLRLERKPVLVIWEGEEYVLVQASHGHEGFGSILLEDLQDVDMISLAPAKFFDLTR